MNIYLQKFIYFILLSAAPFGLKAQTAGIIPQPVTIVKNAGSFQLTSSAITGINNSSLLPQANYLQIQLSKTEGWTVPVDPDEVKAVIDLQLVKDTLKTGSYSLKITPGKIIIRAGSNEGVFYGIVSLLQMVMQQPQGAIVMLPSCQVDDSPRYQWRGFMLDESRHFFGKEKVEQLLDWMAYYKLNKFHWHLTDVNGWRIEIKKYPLLTTVGGIGNHSDTLAPAKYYTQDDIKEIVAYAQNRFITVIPEIDMPGHAAAAVKAYPEFDGGSTAKYPHFTFDPANEKTYSFLSDILHEVHALFPSQMIHLGGDEVTLGIQAWEGHQGISAIIEKYKFNSLTDVEHYFFKRMADTVISMGDKILCWDEAAETDLPADKTIVFWWRQNVPSQLELALQKKYDIVLCPRLPLYFDFVQDSTNISGRRWNGRFFNKLSSVYNFPDKQMASDELQSNQILGIQANIWTETVGSAKRLDYMIFPRIAALAEAAWTNPAKKNEASFDERLKAELPLYDKAGIYYYNPFNPSMHPEAVDFVPHIIKPEKGRRHGRRGHHRHGRQMHLKHHVPGRHTKTKRKRKR